MSFTTLAAFKRALVPNAHFKFRYARIVANPQELSTRSQAISDWFPRVVVRQQTNAVAFSRSDEPAAIERAAGNPHSNATWLQFPKAADCTFPEPGLIRIANGDPDHWLEYRQIDDPAQATRP